MRDVVTGFYLDVLRKLMAAGSISRDDSVLIVCGGPLDSKVFSLAGFTDVTLTNLDGGMADQRQDAENLTYEDGSFDVVAVHAGLHHCHSPHRALLEMYRVSRKCVLAFESRDSLLMKVAVRTGLTFEFETESVLNGRGGVADSAIPNYVYRWTEREIRKAISSFDPAHFAEFKFFYEVRLPIQRLSKSGSHALRALAITLEPLSRLFTKLFPKQGNEFAFAVLKSSRKRFSKDTL